MKLTQVRGNTWVLDSWELIPLYKLDDHRCVLLDTGTVEQREDLEDTLDEAGLTPVAILGSHTHIDHMGSHAYFQKTRGTQVVMSLGEAGQIFSPLGLQLQYNNFPMALFPDYPELGTAPCVPDRVILPGEEAVTLFGATFGILRTPGHTVDHICVRTPDDVLYVADAMMTGRTLHYAKFPYALSMETYLDSMVKLREAKAACYVVAHKGIYEDIRPFIDLELQFLRQRMEELADLMTGPTTPKDLTVAICQTYQVGTQNPRTLAYFEHASEVYLRYLVSQGLAELRVEKGRLVYRRVQRPARAVAAMPSSWVMSRMVRSYLTCIFLSSCKIWA